MTKDDIKRVLGEFAAAAKRIDRIGFDVIELHGAHGYLGHQFLSPLSNQRTDEYGGSSENRMRFMLEMFQSVRDAFNADKPIGVRLSATDWVEGGWTPEETVVLARKLKELGCDYVDVSTGGLDPRRDCRVVRRDDLGAITQVHLVAVVPGRIVAGRHHDAGGRAQFGDRPRTDGCRQRTREQQRAHTMSGEDTSRIGRELLASVSGIEADHDPAFADIESDPEEIPNEAGRRASDGETVHPIRTGTEFASQSGGAEAQSVIEPVTESRFVGDLEEPRHLVPGGRIRIGRRPPADPVEEFGVDAHGSIRRQKSTRRRSSTSGRGPTCEMISAAAIEPSRPHSGRLRPVV